MPLRSGALSLQPYSCVFVLFVLFVFFVFFVVSLLPFPPYLLTPVK